MWYTYAVEYYSAIKNSEITPFSATRMALEIIILSQTEKDQYYTTLLIYVESLKWIQMNLFTKQNRVTEVENNLIVMRGVKRRGTNWENLELTYIYYYI